MYGSCKKKYINISIIGKFVIGLRFKYIGEMETKLASAKAWYL